MRLIDEVIVVLSGLCLYMSLISHMNQLFLFPLIVKMFFSLSHINFLFLLSFFLFQLFPNFFNGQNVSISLNHFFLFSYFFYSSDLRARFSYTYLRVRARMGTFQRSGSPGFFRIQNPGEKMTS